MKTFALATLLMAASASAQLSYNETTGEFSCAVPNGAYCAGDSLTSNIIVRCTAGKGQPGNCNNNLAGVPPVGVKTAALCYQSSAIAADAACSLNGVAYPDNGDKFNIPGAGYGSSSSSSVASASTPVSTTVKPSGTGVTVSPPPYPTTSKNGTVPNPTLSTGYTRTGTGAPSYTGTSTPTPTLFPGAASQVFASSFAALLPVAGLLAFLF